MPWQNHFTIADYIIESGEISTVGKPETFSDTDHCSCITWEELGPMDIGNCCQNTATKRIRLRGALINYDRIVCEEHLLEVINWYQEVANRNQEIDRIMAPLEEKNLE
ncbi:hypothetical protein C4588_06905 [Candidatus Parcubacteria bacterium]|nr:MAG: hypothetical protein C4588_06905 [Candidatus Parcubacteria bacterium]